MAVILKPHELRVLGVLIEKSMATPQNYPLTLNSVILGCNQKSSREPVLFLSEGEVSAALHELKQWQLLSQAPPDRNSRANRFCHEVEKRFGWNAPQRAIMAELMLRGPQTVGELRTNAGRLARLEASDYAREVIRELETCDPPMIVELPRQPGQSATRFAHLLGGPIDVHAVAASFGPASPPVPEGAPSPRADSDLRAQVANLQSEIESLRAEVRALAERLTSAGV